MWNRNIGQPFFGLCGKTHRKPPKSSQIDGNPVFHLVTSAEETMFLAELGENYWTDCKKTSKIANVAMEEPVSILGIGGG